MTATRGETLTIRITADTRRRLDEACEQGTYRISKTSIVERGIELALEELARMEAAK